MAMRPLDGSERDALFERLGPDPMRRLDALVCAGYALHACGSVDPTRAVADWIALAAYVATAEPVPFPPDRLTLHLLDAEEGLWQGSDATGWCCDELTSDDPLSREDVVAKYGPVREAWVR